MLVTSEDPERLVQAYPEYFDKILLDAPCSGEGMFRKEHSMIAAWRERGPSWYAPIQRELIRQARQMLRPGGYLLYSTCTFSLEENEKVIDDFLEESPDMELCPVEPYEGFAPGVSVGAGDLPAAIYNYANMIEGEDISRAMNLYRKVAYGEHPLPAAAYALGRLYENQRQLREAINCYERAIDGGVTEALRDLERCRNTLC